MLNSTSRESHMISRNQKPPFLSIAAAVAITMFFCQVGRDLPAQPRPVQPRPAQPGPTQPGPAENQLPRYQISAWGHLNRNGTDTTRGVYIIDTITGQLWHKEGQFPIKNLGFVNPG